MLFLAEPEDGEFLNLKLEANRNFLAWLFSVLQLIANGFCYN